jgi:hypothetical protein
VSEEDDAKQRISAVEQALLEMHRNLSERRRVVDEELNTLRDGLNANTMLTLEAKSELTKLRGEVQPVVDAMKTMQAGIRTIGRIGTFATLVGKALLFLAAFWTVLRLMGSGATWDEAVAGFWRIMSGVR